MKDIIIALLSAVVILGFFSVVAYKLYMNQDVQLEIGAMIGAFSGVIGYWFGSSVGSARKTELMASDKPL